MSSSCNLLAITQLDGSSRLVQKNDDICTAGSVGISSISGATSFFGTSTPILGQIVDAVENRWRGSLTTNHSIWTWNLTNAQEDMLIKVTTDLNEGRLIMNSGCPKKVSQHFRINHGRENWLKLRDCAPNIQGVVVILCPMI